MQEVTGNLWTFPAHIRVITTNGTVKKNGECVMGRGCAAEAKKLFNGISWLIGSMIKEDGNNVYVFSYPPAILATFPVKHNWYEKADLCLIKRSAEQLAKYCENMPKGYKVVLPRPGCGNGGLRWEDVKPILAPILDDRFHVICFEHERGQK